MGPYRTNAIVIRRPRSLLYRAAVRMIAIVFWMCTKAGKPPTEWRWWRKIIGGYWYRAWVQDGEPNVVLMWFGPYADPHPGSPLVEGTEEWHRIERTESYETQ